MPDFSSLIGGVGYNTPTGGPSGLFLSLDPSYQAKQLANQQARIQINQEQAFSGGLPTDASGNTDWNAVAQRSAQLGDFANAERMQQLGFDMRGLDLAGRYAGAFGGGGQGGAAPAPANSGPQPAAGGGMIAPSAGGDDNGVLPPSNPAPGSAPAAGGQGAAPGAPGDYLSRLSLVENGGKYGGDPSAAGALGRYQFTASTWAGLAQKYPELDLTPDGRTDPAQQQRAIQAFTNDNVSALGRAGFQATPGNLYLAHFAGVGGVTAALNADPNTPVSTILGGAAVKANPFLQGMTAGGLVGWANGKMAGVDPSTVPGTPGGMPPDVASAVVRLRSGQGTPADRAAFIGYRQSLAQGQPGAPAPGTPPAPATGAPAMPAGGQSQPISFGGGDASSAPAAGSGSSAADAPITDDQVMQARKLIAATQNYDPRQMSPEAQRAVSAATDVVDRYQQQQAAAGDSSPGTVAGAPAAVLGEAPRPGTHPYAPGGSGIKSPPATPPMMGGGQSPQGAAPPSGQGGFQPISFGGGGAPPAPAAAPGGQGAVTQPAPGGTAPQSGVAQPATVAPPPASAMPPNVAAALARLRSNQGSPADGQLWGAYQASLAKGGAPDAPVGPQGGIAAAPAGPQGGVPVGAPVSPPALRPQNFGTGNTPLMNDPGVAGILRSYKGGQFVGDPGAALMDMRNAQMVLSGGGKYANPMAATFGKTADYLEQAITRSATLTNEQRNARDPAVLAEAQQKAQVENNARLQADIDPSRISFAGQQAQATAAGTAAGQTSPTAVTGAANKAGAVAEATKQGDYYGGLPAAYAKQADAARATSDNVDQMLSAAQGFRMGAGSGIEQDARKTLQGTLGFLGVSDPKLNDPTASYEDFGKMAGVLNRNAAQQVGGRTGVQEMQLIASTLPSPEMSYDGFRTVASSLKGSADYTIGKQQAAQDWLADPSHGNSLSGFEASFNRNTSPSAFWLNRLRVDQPDLFQRTVQGLGQTPRGRALLAKAKTGMSWANTNGLLN